MTNGKVYIGKTVNTLNQRKKKTERKLVMPLWDINFLKKPNKKYLIS